VGHFSRAELVHFSRAAKREVVNYRWLVQVASSYPRIGQQVLIEPSLAGATLPYPNLKTAVRLCEFGLWPGDPVGDPERFSEPRRPDDEDPLRDCVRELGPTHVARRRLDHLFVASKELASARVEILDMLDEEDEELPPIPGARLDPESIGESPTLIDAGPAAFTPLAYYALRYGVVAARKLGVTIGEAVAALRGLMPSAYPDFDERSEFAAHRVTSEDAMLLSRDLNGKSPVLWGKIPSGHVVLASAQLGLTMGDVCDRLARFSPLGLDLPSLPRDLRAYSATIDDVFLLSRYLNGRKPLLDGVVPPSHIPLASALFGLTVGEVRDRLARFSPMGIDVPRSLPPDLRAHRVTKDDLAVLPLSLERRQLLGDLRDQLAHPTMPRYLPVHHDAIADVLVLFMDLDERSEAIQGVVAPSRIVLASASLGLTLGEIRDRLARFAPLGVVVPPELPPETAAFRAEHEDLVMLSRNLDAAEPWLGSSLSRDHLREGAEKLGRSVETLEKRLVLLTPFGISIVD